MTCATRPGASIENHRLPAIHQNAVIDVPAHRARQHHLFQIAALLQQVIEPVAVGDADHVLLDDRAFVEIGGDVMAGGADQFHAAVEGAVVRLGAAERGQKRVMDIDNSLRIAGDEVRRQDLHVAGEHDKIDALLRQDFKLLPLGRGFVADDGNVEERYALEVGPALRVRVVADDSGHVARQLAALVPVEEIDEAVVVLRDE